MNRITLKNGEKYFSLNLRSTQVEKGIAWCMQNGEGSFGVDRATIFIRGDERILIYPFAFTVRADAVLFFAAFQPDIVADNQA